MNIFRSDSVPYAIVLLVATLGWLLNSFWTELTASRVISFKLDTAAAGKISTLHVRNISRLKTIKDFTFSLVCNGELCFDEIPDGYSSPIYHPPLFSQEAKEAQSAFEIGYKVTLVAGGHLQIDFRRNSESGDIRFFYRPQSGSEELYVFEESIATYAVRHTVGIYFWSLVLAVAAFVLVVLGSLLGKRKEVSDEKPKELVVGIYRHRGQQSAGTGRKGDDPGGGQRQQPARTDPKPREDHGRRRATGGEAHKS